MGSEASSVVTASVVKLQQQLNQQLAHSNLLFQQMESWRNVATVQARHKEALQQQLVALTPVSTGMDLKCAFPSVKQLKDQYETLVRLKRENLLELMLLTSPNLAEATVQNFLKCIIKDLFAKQHARMEMKRNNLFRYVLRDHSVSQKALVNQKKPAVAQNRKDCKDHDAKTHNASMHGDVSVHDMTNPERDVWSSVLRFERLQFDSTSMKSTLEADVQEQWNSGKMAAKGASHISNFFEEDSDCRQGLMEWMTEIARFCATCCISEPSLKLEDVSQFHPEIHDAQKSVISIGSSVMSLFPTLQVWEGDDYKVLIRSQVRSVKAQALVGPLPQTTGSVPQTSKKKPPMFAPVPTPAAAV